MPLYVVSMVREKNTNIFSMPTFKDLSEYICLRYLLPARASRMTLYIFINEYHQNASIQYGRLDTECYYKKTNMLI